MTSSTEERFKPEESHGQERKEIQEQIPAAVSRRSHFHLDCRLSAALGTFQTDARQPALLGVEGYLGFKLYSVTQRFTLGPVTGFSESTADRVDADFNRDVFRQCPALRRIQNNKIGPDADIRIGPD